MKVECTNFGEARACARTRGGSFVPKYSPSEIVNFFKIWAPGPTCWASREFEFAALEFKLPIGGATYGGHVSDVTDEREKIRRSTQNRQ